MHLKLSKGHDFKLKNHPSQEIIDVSAEANNIILHPLTFPYIKPKLLIEDGSKVEVGTPIFIDKLNPDVKFVSPVSGSVKTIEYGERRSIQSITIVNDFNYMTRKEMFGELEESGEDAEVITSPMDKSSWVDLLKESGLWTLIRQRPFSKIADTNSTPKSIFISLYDTRPYGCNPELVISSNKKLFNNGLKLLGKIANCPIHITAGRNFDLDLINIGNQRSSNLHSVEGPHPAGNVGVQIHHIDPMSNKDDIRWYLDVNSVIDLGYLFEHKTYNPYKIISVCGEELLDPNFRKIVKNQSLDSILSPEEITQAKSCRLISGDMLSGTEKNINNGIGNYDEMKAGSF